MREAADRVGYMGASTAAAALGYDSFRSSLAVQRQCLGIEPPTPDEDMGDAAEMGLDFEPTMARWLGGQLNRRVQRVPRRGGSRRKRHPRHSWLGCDIDYLIVGEDALGELKTTGLTGPVPERWGPQFTDQVPAKVRIQCQLQLGISRRRTAYVGALIGGRGRCLFIVPFDRRLYRAIVADLADWWKLHIIDQVPPRPRDGTEAKLVFPESNPRRFIRVDAERLDMIARWNNLTHQRDRSQLELDVLSLQLQELIQDADGIADGLGPLLRWPTHRHLDESAFVGEFPDLASPFQDGAGKIDRSGLQRAHPIEYHKHKTRPVRVNLQTTTRGASIR